MKTQKQYPFTSDKYTGEEFMTVADLEKIFEFTRDDAVVVIQCNGKFHKVRLHDVEGFGTYMEKDIPVQGEYLLKDEIKDKDMEKYQEVFILSPTF